MATQLNKIYAVTTINRVAVELGVEEELLSDLAKQMEPEDGLIRVYGLSDNDYAILAFTDFGIESLKELLRIRVEKLARNRPQQVV